MPRKNSTQAPHGGRGDHVRRKRSKWSLAVIGGPVILAVVAGTVFAAGGRHHGRGQANGGEAATPDPNCTLVVPQHPLSARGLATPYRLVATDPAKGPCHEANTDQAAFVEAAILTKDGSLSVYDPLVIDRGTRPAARTVRPRVPRGSTVAIWFGFNSAELRLKSSGRSDSLAQGRCVNGVPGSVFGQFAYCNAPAFFRAAKTRTAAKHLKIPALGTAKDGLPCPTTRDFSVVDQDGSDNVVTRYLADAHGRIAQDNAANRAALHKGVRVDAPRYRHHRHHGRGGRAGSPAGAQPKELTNGSDNLLLTQFIDPALGCKPFMVPNQSSDNRASSALPLDELSAAARQRAPIALVPQNDPMTLVDGRTSVRKTNAYRAGVGMPPVGAGSDGNGAAFCTTLFGDAAGIQRVFKDKELFRAAPSPDPGTAPDLFGFLAARANQTFTNLGCDRLLGVGDPVMLTTDGNGLVVDAVLTRLGQTPPASGGPTNGASPSATQSASTPPAADPSATAGTQAPSSSPSDANGGPADPSSAAPTPSTTTEPPSPSSSPSATGYTN
ncbi:hypothetical protein [Streptomyces sediminimaris]|uniref:hypothetical protein n=1 Tax=Streptomyces sediminimaris TaxID=3383721 RepID=UPI0039995BD8